MWLKFVFIAVYYSMVWPYHSMFTHLTIDGHMDLGDCREHFCTFPHTYTHLPHFPQMCAQEHNGKIIKCVSDLSMSRQTVFRSDGTRPISRRQELRVATALSPLRLRRRSYCCRVFFGGRVGGEGSICLWYYFSLLWSQMKLNTFSYVYRPFGFLPS